MKPKDLNRLEEIYDFFKTNGYIPAQNSVKERFKDGRYMGTWINYHKKEIKELAENNEKAKKIDELIESKSNYRFSIKQEKIKEVFEMLKTKSVEEVKTATFKDGVNTYTWLIDKKQYIKQEMEKGNPYATSVFKTFYKRNQMTFEERLKEAVEYVMLSNKLPANGSKVKFSDGTNMPIWVHNYEKKIREMSDSGNAEAQLVEFYMKKRSRPSYLDIEVKIHEFCEFIKENKKFPSCNDLFSNKTLMYNWYYANKEKLRKMATDGNKEAKSIIELASKYQKRKNTISFDEKINELYEYIKKNKKLPIYYEKHLFSDGINMTYWLQSNNKKIEKLSQNNLKAKLINTLFKEKQRFKCTLDSGINQVIEFYQANKYLPKKYSSEKFSNGGLIWKWLVANKYRLYARYKEGDEKATIIINAMLECNYTIMKIVKMKKKEEEFRRNSIFGNVEHKNKIYTITKDNTRKLKKD